MQIMRISALATVGLAIGAISAQAADSVSLRFATVGIGSA